MKDAKQIIRELVEEVIEEMTGTGAISVPPGKYAFGGDAEEAAERSMPGGSVVKNKKTKKDNTSVEESEGSLPTVRRDLNIMESRSRYRNFRESDMMKNHAKISYGIREAKKMLGEVEYLVSICERLKTECGYTNENLWARTQPDMKEIHSRLKEIAKRINRMGK